MSLRDERGAVMPEVGPDSAAEAAGFYRRHGFARVRGIITPAEVATYHAAALEASLRLGTGSGRAVFDQHVNVWRHDPVLRQLTLHAAVARVAETLAGVPLRLWHDHILIKRPHNHAPTQFHQDQPYWPHANADNPISCWLALCDVPVERGCMTFLPGSHRRTDLHAQNLGDARSLFALAPELEWSERVTVPLRAGDCTFHHGRCAHMATPNETDEPRVAHVIIYMDRDAQYRAQPHVVTDPLKLPDGAPLDGELFPTVAAITGGN